MPCESTTVAAKSAVVETWTRYEMVPAEGFHVSVELTKTFAAPLGGETSEGALGIGGGFTVVVNCQESENPLSPAMFLARTLQ